MRLPGMSRDNSFWYIKNRGSYKAPNTTFGYCVKQLSEPGVLWYFAELYGFYVDGELWFYLPDKLKFGVNNDDDLHSMGNLE